MPTPSSNLRLLFVTQALDLDDPVLSVYHGWVRSLASEAEAITVIALKVGRHALPENVRIFSLGKERGRVHPLRYAWRFLTLVSRERSSYDAVLVHMNQEYLLIAGWLWKLLGKRAYLWRNHYAGSFLTDLAAASCRKIFYTSTHSYTAKFARAKRMPVGVDLARFLPDTRVSRVPRSILFFARMAESKRPGLVIDALIELCKRGVAFTASFVGSPLPKDEAYLAALRQRVADAGLMERIRFAPGIPNDQAPDLYRAHELFVNASPSGMLDKTIFEAAASGCIVLAASDDWSRMAGGRYTFSGRSELADRLEEHLGTSASPDIRQIAREHDLQALSRSLAEEMVG